MKKRFILAAALLLCAAYAANAQTALRGSYFFESSLQRSKLNPAFAPKTNYFNFPGLGNIGVDVASNLGAANFLYPAEDGTLYTYLNSNVSAEEFTSNLPDEVYADVAVDIDILGWGHRTKGGNGYINFGITARTDVSSMLPGEFFRMTKLGMATDPITYQLGAADLTGNVLADVNLSYAHNLSDLLPGLSVGFRLHALASPGVIDAHLNNAEVMMSGEYWRVISDSEAHITGPFDITRDATGTIEGVEFNKEKLGVKGYGFTADLGISYTFQTGLNFLSGIALSASVADLGLMIYDDSEYYCAGGNSVTYTGIKGISADSDINEEISALEKDLKMAVIPAYARNEIWTQHLPLKYYAGAELQFFGNNIGLGMLYSKVRNHDELTASLNFKNLRTVNFGVNYSILNSGRAAGFIFEFVPRGGISLFLGSDYVVFDYTKQYIPLYKTMANLRLGTSITFGGKRF